MLRAQCCADSPVPRVRGTERADSHAVNNRIRSRCGGVWEWRVAPRIPIGQLLVRSGRVDSVQLSFALAHQQKWGGRLGDALIALKLVSEPELLTELARQHGVQYAQIGERFVPAEIVRLVPQRFIRARRVFPIALGPDHRRGRLFVATSEPQNLPMLDEVAFLSGMAVQPVLVGDRDLDEVIKRHLGSTVPRAPLSQGAGSQPLTSGGQGVVAAGGNLQP